MRRKAQISVVMSVYNGIAGLPKTLDSVLSQSGVDLEFIVVNDGSTDESLAVLQDYAARDKRLKILDQTHRGLTLSLIRGCEAAEGDFIARQDAGDVSLPGRLEKQLAGILARPNPALVSCGARFFGPDGEFLYEVQKASDEADQALRSPDLDSMRGPAHHGSTMFPRNQYIRAGGYRPQFEVAQDLDLWTRLVELGRHEVVQEILYEAVLTPGSITSEKRRQQEVTTKVISECVRSRMATGDDRQQLEWAARISGNGARFNRRRSDADFYYFLASCLRRNDSRRAKHYLHAALKQNPFHLKALARAIQVKLGAY